MADSDDKQKHQGGEDPAANLVRSKISGLYGHEPEASEEISEVQSEPAKDLSKHQLFMKQLNDSGKSTAEIQTDWHNYYSKLTDYEKHQVWQEFYAYRDNPQPAKVTQPQHHEPKTTIGIFEDPTPKPKRINNLAELKHRSTTSHNTHHNSRRARAKRSLKSLLFGLSLGGVVVLVLLFGFFNDRFIAPFITPSRNVSATPILINPSSTAIGKEPLIIIPKINAQIPVVYNEASVDEASIQNALNSGVVHYATTPNPGQLGNGAIFGHSSGNILNQGHYKFAFTLLKKLDVGDTFMLQKGQKLYVYRVYKKHIVAPTDVDVLNTQDKPATFTLITCDPPGLSINRLIVVGEQISPNPETDKPSTAVSQPAQIKTLPSNSVSLWQRVLHWF